MIWILVWFYGWLFVPTAPPVYYTPPPAGPTWQAPVQQQGGPTSGPTQVIYFPPCQPTVCA